MKSTLISEKALVLTKCDQTDSSQSRVNLMLLRRGIEEKMKTACAGKVKTRSLS